MNKAWKFDLNHAILSFVLREKCGGASNAITSTKDYFQKRINFIITFISTNGNCEKCCVQIVLEKCLGSL